MRRAAVVLLVLVAVTTAACGVLDTVEGSGNVVRDERSVEGFTAVAARGIGDVEVRRTGVESVTVEAEDNLQEYLEAEVRGGTLVLGVRDNTILRATQPIRFLVTVADLERIETSGSGDLVADGIESDSLEMRTSGSGDVEVRGLTGGSVDVEASGSGTVTLGGRVDDQSADLSGSGDYWACGLESLRAEVDTSGSGDVIVSIAERLRAESSGSGDLRYRAVDGADVEVDSDASGSGEIGRIDSCPG